MDAISFAKDKEKLFSERNKNISKDYDSMKSLEKVAAKWDLSREQIRRIIKEVNG